MASTPPPFDRVPDEPAAPAPPDIHDVLARLGIRYARYDHAPVNTCDEAERAVPEPRDALHTKNLFLRDKKGRRHWLLVTLCSTAVDLRQLAGRIGADHLSFGSPDRLARYLHITPGAVTILALVADHAHEVELVVDAAAWTGAALRCHPLVNTSTLVIGHADLQRFLAFTGHVPLVVQVPERH